LSAVVPVMNFCSATDAEVQAGSGRSSPILPSVLQVDPGRELQ
jgi:hypothetical protein